MKDSECKLDSGTAVGICSYAYCEYECSAGRSCPPGMGCLDIDDGFGVINRCRYMSATSGSPGGWSGEPGNDLGTPGGWSGTGGG